VNRNEIFDKLFSIFKMVVNNPNSFSIAEESDLRYDLGITSVGLIYLVIGIEEDFDVDMSSSSFSSFKTVKDVIDYIEARMDA